MTVTVYLFGHYSDIFGGEPVDLQLPSGSTVRDATAQLVSRDARLANIANHCRFALDEEYTTLDAELTDGCVIAALPPMSGG